MKKLIIAIFIIFFSAQYSPAAVDVTSVTDEGGGVYTIGGSGFGVKTTAAPATWLGANIEAGTNGATFAASGWGTSGGVYSTAQASSGTKSILYDFYDTYATRVSWFDFGGGVNDFYFTAWIYFDKVDTCYRFQWKVGRLKGLENLNVTSDNATITDYWASDTTWGTVTDKQLYCYLSTGGYTSWSDIASDSFVFDSWQRIEFIYRRNTGSGNADGVLTQRRIGKTGDILSLSNAVTHVSTPEWRYFYMGHFYGSLYNSNSSACVETRDANIYYDDVYIDNTQARVEICDASTWAARTQCEIQIPSAWSTTEITITTNQGSLDTLAGKYVYVVDLDGTVNANGKVTGGADVTAPELVTATIDSAGTSLTMAFTEPVTTDGAGYHDADLDLDCTSGGDDVALTYSSGTGTNTLVYTIASTILGEETCNLDFNGDADSIEDVANNDLAAIVSGTVYNNSTQSQEEVVVTVQSLVGGVGGTVKGIGTTMEKP